MADQHQKLSSRRSWQSFAHTAVRPSACYKGTLASCFMADIHFLMSLHEPNATHDLDPQSETLTLRDDFTTFKHPTTSEFQDHEKRETRPPEADVVEYQEDLSPSERRTNALESDSNVYIVNWDGPDDAQNPKKYVLIQIYLTWRPCSHCPSFNLRQHVQRQE